MIDRIWEILTTFTEKAQQGATDKCAELGYDPDRGVVSLNESFINLNSARLTLADAIEKKKLIQLPISIQKILLGHIEAISKSLTNLIGGADEVINLTQAIENLNTAIWQYGLHNLSEEVLGYQEKLNQLKQLDLETRNLNAELRKGRKLKSVLEALIGEFKKSDESIKANLSKSVEETKSISNNLASATKINQDAAAILAAIQKSDETIAKYLSDSKASNADITALETKIKEFYDVVNNYKSTISKIQETAENAMKENKTETDKLISDLKELEGQIKSQLQKATGATLFHSFDTRKTALAKSKLIWAIALGMLVLISIGLTFYIIRDLKTINDVTPIFYVKLSFALPLIYGIAFCHAQYSHERKLEEEYAFKSNISLSLIPYQELVEKMIDGEKPEEREKYTSFMIESLQKVFSSPTEKVFEGEKKQEKEEGITDKAIKQFNQISEHFVKIAETVVKGLIHK